MFPEEKPSADRKTKEKRKKKNADPDPARTFDERGKRLWHYMETKGMHERWIETAEGEIRIVIEALADYYDMAGRNVRAMETGYPKAVWEDRLEKIKKIQAKLEESVGYSRDGQLEICKKRKPRGNDDIGEDAMILAVRGKQAERTGTGH